jgi:hypothetical protein
MRLKPGVKIAGLKPETVLGLLIVEAVFLRYGEECWLTAVVDGKHMLGSRHGNGYAADLRSKHLKTLALKINILNDLKEYLGADFDVVLENQGKENEHFHCEYDPK